MQAMDNGRFTAVAAATAICLSMTLFAVTPLAAEDTDETFRRFSRPAELKEVDQNSERSNAAARPSGRKAQRAKLRWKSPGVVRTAVHTSTDEDHTAVRQVKLDENDARQVRLQLGDPAPADDRELPGFGEPFGDAPDTTDVPVPGPSGDTQAPAEIDPPADDRLQEMPSDNNDFSGEPFALAPQGNTKCPSVRDLKPIGEITNAIAPKGDLFPAECPLGAGPFQPRMWGMTTYTWKASGLCHKPLYFEQVTLERYGHSFAPLLEPVVSGAHFFATLPILPYKMGINPPWECQYPLGYYRPGSCAPHMIMPFPISLRGAVVEGAVATGLVFLIP